MYVEYRFPAGSRVVSNFKTSYFEVYILQGKLYAARSVRNRPRPREHQRQAPNSFHTSGSSQTRPANHTGGGRRTFQPQRRMSLHRHMHPLLDLHSPLTLAIADATAAATGAHVSYGISHCGGCSFKLCPRKTLPLFHARGIPSRVAAAFFLKLSKKRVQPVRKKVKTNKKNC